MTCGTLQRSVRYTNIAKKWTSSCCCLMSSFTEIINAKNTGKSILEMMRGLDFRFSLLLLLERDNTSNSSMT